MESGETRIDAAFERGSNRVCERLDRYVEKSKEPVVTRFVEIPVFYGGGDLRPWIDWMEKRFASDDFTDDQKIAMASGFIDGKAASWYHEQISQIPFQSWEDLKSELLLRYGNVYDPELVTFLRKWKLQWSNVMAYPIFYGDDVKLWISMIERRFHRNILWNREKLEFALRSMEGEAKSFVHSKQSIMIFHSWNQLKDELVVRFGRDDDPDKIRLQIERERDFRDWVKRCESRYRETKAVVDELSQKIDDDDAPQKRMSVAGHSVQATETDTNENVDTDAEVACEPKLIATDLNTESMGAEQSLQAIEEIDTMIAQPQVLLSVSESSLRATLSIDFRMNVVVANQATMTHDTNGSTQVLETADDHVIQNIGTDKEREKRIIEAKASNQANETEIEYLNCEVVRQSAHRLFDQMPIGGRGENQQSFLSKIPKSWRFKFKEGLLRSTCPRTNFMCCEAEVEPEAL
ncbi:unnamed protein product [Brassica rapa]|uniref:Retrotransposon gag domain-containing protein n=1 Tax=Brassica campestris TaxID=3711 RepID=A0A3P6B7Y2_BRACM|nr:unnamed protein product [Brassica rapa]VDD01193.1 unnamed protein product [Brassica rapa]